MIHVVPVNEGGVGDPVVSHSHSYIQTKILLNSMALMYMLKLPILAI